MHLTREPEPLHKHCNAPLELCKLVARMLEKDPALRPGSIEVRQIARAIALELSPPYEELEISGGDADDRPGASHGRGVRAAYIVADDDVTDAESLEYGVTEMLPVVLKPRWTPEMVRVPNPLAEQRRRQLIGPRAPRDQVAGEVVSSTKLR